MIFSRNQFFIGISLKKVGGIQLFDVEVLGIHGFLRPIIGIL
jgi:hypothetical protein